MIIDLRSYDTEVRALTAAAKPCVDQASKPRLDEMLSQLKTGRDGRMNHFIWQTLKPIVTIPTTRYDKVGREMPAVTVEFAFYARFERLRHPDWTITRLETHLAIVSDRAAEPVLKIHFDQANPGQRGPYLHMQVSEQTTEKLGLRLAVPRFPFAFVLPTDVLDFLMVEFFFDDWWRRQVLAPGMTHVRNAQLQRGKMLCEALLGYCNELRARTPVSLLQNCSFDSYRLN